MTKKLKKPFGLIFLPIWQGFFAGVMPLLFALISLYYFTSYSAENSFPLDDSFNFSMLLNIIISIMVIFASINLLRMKKDWRNKYLMIISSYYSITIVNSLYSILLNKGIHIPEDQYYRIIGRIIRNVLWLVITLWYFLRPQTLAFFNNYFKKKS